MICYTLLRLITPLTRNGSWNSLTCGWMQSAVTFVFHKSQYSSKCHLSKTLNWPSYGVVKYQVLHSNKRVQMRSSHYNFNFFRQYRVLLEKPEGRRPLGRPRRRWVDNIRMALQEVGCGYMDWTGLAQDRDRWRTRVSAVMNFLVPWNAGNFLTGCKPVSCSGRTLHHGVSK